MRTLTPLRQIILFLCIVLTLHQHGFAQSVRQSTQSRIISSKQTVTVRSFTENDIQYVSIKDLADRLSFNYYENTVLKKVEIKLERGTLKFSAENAFVVLTNPVTKQYHVHQLSQPVVIEQQLFFAPAKEFIALLKSLDDTLFSIEESKSVSATIFPATPVVSGFALEQKKNGYLFRIHLTGKVRDVNRSLQIGEWIYVTLPGAQGDTLRLDTAFADGIIRRVKSVQSPTSLQLSLQIRGKVENSEIVQDQLSDDILLTLIPPMPDAKKEVNADSIRRYQEMQRTKQQLANDIKKQKKKWKLDVVVIDPGHGGHDPGAIGTIGTREKDITLGISLKLGELIEKEMPDVKVVYTRKTDRFVELYRRGQIANEHEGKLFISIHSNSTERKPSNANGFEIYLLRPGKTEDAIRIAEKENAVVKLEKDYEDRYQELNDENFIILTMAQSAYVKQSERFAELLEETMSAEMQAQRQAVKQAGFYVLVGASMPNVLVETGYLSNPKEERFLRSPTGQKKIAEAILNALKGFKREYDKDIDW